MEKIILNEKTVVKRKKLKDIRKQYNKTYAYGRSNLKAGLGKVVCLKESAGIEKGMMYQEKRMEPSSFSGEKWKPEKLMNELDNINLSGMSGNGFPVNRKLEKVSMNLPAKILIVNGVECDPGLLHDRWLISNRLEQVKQGISFLKQMLAFERCILAYSMDKQERKKQKKEKSTEAFEVCHVPARYPMGEEHFLIKQILGIELEKESYPSEHGILVMNVQTVYQIYCLLTGTYENGRWVTLVNLNTGEAGIHYVLRGENIKEKLKEVFGESRDLPCFAGGGIMSAHEVITEEVFSDAICFAAVGNHADINNQHRCRGCGKCNRMCPAGVNVREIVRRREKDINADISDLGIEKCVKCGCCTFFCKAGKNTTAYFDE